MVTTSKGIDRMKDKEYLQWMHDRLQYQHDENPNYDYMHKLRAIIKDYDEDKHTFNSVSVVERSGKAEYLNIVKAMPQEVVQEPEQFVPVVGEECEVWHGDEWHTCLFLGVILYGDYGYQIIEGEFKGGMNGDKDLSHFRTVKTYREKVIAWAMKEWMSKVHSTTENLFGSMYDLGALSMPENDNAQ